MAFWKGQCVEAAAVYKVHKAWALECGVGRSSSCTWSANSHAIWRTGTKASSVLMAVPDTAVSEVVTSVENSLTKT